MTCQFLSFFRIHYCHLSFLSNFGVLCRRCFHNKLLPLWLMETGQLRKPCYHFRQVLIYLNRLDPDTYRSIWMKWHLSGLISIRLIAVFRSRKMTETGFLKRNVFLGRSISRKNNVDDLIRESLCAEEARNTWKVCIQRRFLSNNLRFLEINVSFSKQHLLFIRKYFLSRLHHPLSLLNAKTLRC